VVPKTLSRQVAGRFFILLLLFVQNEVEIWNNAPRYAALIAPPMASITFPDAIFFD
jgi:hypothetical protein